MVSHAETLPSLKWQLVANFSDEHVHSPVLSNGHAARVARKSAFLSLSPACNFEAFSRHFHLPLKVAAEKFGVRATAFKKRCRAIGIRHWPYRKVRSLKRSLHELHRWKEHAPLGGKQEAQCAIFQCQLATLMAPETYGLDPCGRLGPHVMSDDEDVASEDGNDSFVSSPRVDRELSFDYCTKSPTNRDNQMVRGVIPAGASHLPSRRSQGMQLPLARVAFKRDESCLKATKSVPLQRNDTNVAPFAKRSNVMKATLTDKNGIREDDWSSGLPHLDRDFSPSETQSADGPSLTDVDEEYMAHASHVDYSSDRFFDEVFLQISPDYGCLV